MDFEIKRGGHKDLYRIFPMMEFDFRPFELISQTYLQCALLNASADLLLLKDETGCEAGYAVVYKKSLYGYVMVAYFAVYPTMRGKGAGTRFLALIRERYSDKQGILIEITREAQNAEWTEKRYQLYSRLGYEDVPCAYLVGGVDTTLMCLRLRGPQIISPAAPLILRDIYLNILPERKLDKYMSVKALV